MPNMMNSPARTKEAGQPVTSRRRTTKGRFLLALTGLLVAVSLGMVWAVPAFAASPTLATPAVLHQQTDPSLLYAGAWKTILIPNASGGSLAVANSAGSSVTIHFVGARLNWIAAKGPRYGEARVWLDGKSLGLVDLYHATTILWQQPVWSTGLLKAGPHTVKIAWTGLKHVGSLGTAINLDAYAVSFGPGM